MTVSGPRRIHVKYALILGCRGIEKLHFMDYNRIEFIDNCLLITLETLLEQNEFNEFKDKDEQIDEILNKSVALTEKMSILRDELIKKNGRKSTKANRSRNSSRSQLLTEGNDP